MTQERMDLLNGIEFAWSAPPRYDWGAKFKELEEYESKHGHCCVPKRSEENAKLGNW
eukprot:CAMPEP_0195512764 /NCGR_PEP_ID=MMETSP0794_2-20130614/4618_1 /TAXON_ID=515487 /ORGANISM="Stephanopyxis turris, Strain CCMP 815" /LENGTH=56 /DNA_ID=CAMNT_0040640629 /DNA_START=12 /DNA_END=179 /DNA_ORIENTATION=+